jgi:hypothetical protein
MLTEAISGSVPMAVGVALSPLPVAAVIIILMSGRAGTNAPAFLFGWISGILAVGAIIFVVPGIDTERGEPTVLSGWFRIILGVALLLLSVRQWRQRRLPDAPAETSSFLASLDHIGMLKSSMSGFLLSGVTPKNMLLVAAGAVRIDASMLGPGAQFTALLVFSAIASLGVAAPVAGYFLARQTAEAAFSHWKVWLINNNAAVLILLFLVLGVLLIGRGMKILGVSVGELVGVAALAAH